MSLNNSGKKLNIVITIYSNFGQRLQHTHVKLTEIIKMFLEMFIGIPL